MPPTSLQRHHPPRREEGPPHTDIPPVWGFFFSVHAARGRASTAVHAAAAGLGRGRGVRVCTLGTQVAKRAGLRSPSTCRAALGLALAALFTLRARPAPAEEPHRASPAPEFTPPTEYFPAGTWAAGFAGSAQSSERSARSAGTTSLRASRYGVTSRNGYFLAKRFIVGLRLAYEVEIRRDTTGEGTNTRTVSEGSEETLSLGPWFRYYVPMSDGWAVFGEADWGYTTFYSREESVLDSRVPLTASARGIAVGGGAGFTYFLARGVAFDVVGKTQFARLTGRENERSIRFNSTEFGLFLGFQVYLPEFPF